MTPRKSIAFVPIHVKQALQFEEIYLTTIALDLTVLGQNGSGQNGTDKMVWTICYVDKRVLNKMVADKLVRTKWHGQNVT